MEKTKKLMAGVSATALTLSLAGCGNSNSSLPPKPTDQSCRDWDWSEEEGVWRLTLLAKEFKFTFYIVAFIYNVKVLETMFGKQKAAKTSECPSCS